MLKQAGAVLLLLPAIAWAECGFVSSGSEMTIVVGKNANNKCFTSENFREAFRANLVEAVRHMDAGSPAAMQTARRPAGVNRPSLELPLQQAELYYGQKPKR